MKRPCEWEGLRRVCRFVRRKVGRRGMFLLFLALLDILYGYSMASTPSAAALKVDLLIPVAVWAWMWIGTGIACCTGAFMDRDRVFFGLAAFLKAAWAGAWVNVWIHSSQIPRVWVSVLIWGAFSGIVLVISTWPEVVTIKRNDTPPEGIPEVDSE